MEHTPVSLLIRIRNSPSEQDWAKLVDLCSPLLSVWAKRLGLEGEDAADLVQEVLLLLLKKLPEFQYDPNKSFRAWLKTVSHHKFYEQRRKPGFRPIASIDGVEVAADPSTAFWEKEYRELIVQQALKLMQDHFEPQTWKACWEHTVSGRRAAEIGAELGMSEGAVYVAKSRVMRRLKEEFQGLLE